MELDSININETRDLLRNRDIDIQRINMDSLDVLLLSIG